jgi:pimeloyl-ACP methyl ester carboxylesterase
MNAISPSKPPYPRRHYADGPFGQVHFQVLGPDGDEAGMPLVLLHQAPMTSGQFDAVYAPLAERGFRAIGVDMPGFGMSDPSPGVPTVADFAQVVPAVLDALGIERAALLGHHTGALAANEAAILFPERIHALILNGPLLIDEDARAQFLAPGGLRAWEQGLGGREHAAHMAELFDIRDRMAGGSIGYDRLSDYVVQAFIGRGAFWHGHNAAFLYDQEPRLKLITQPTLILSNTGDEIYPHALRAHDVRPDFAFSALEGGGVDICDQQPEAWADIVAGFLNSVRVRETAET